MNALLSLEVTHCWKDRPQTYVNNTVLYVDTVVHIVRRQIYLEDKFLVFNDST